MDVIYGIAWTYSPEVEPFVTTFKKLTCKIFIKTSPSLAVSVPTKRAWVTASAIFSTQVAAVFIDGSETVK